MLQIFVSVLLWGLFHSLLASLRLKEAVRRRLGDGRMHLYRLFYNVQAILSFLPVLVLIFITPDRQIFLVPMPWSALMVMGEVAALLALVYGFMQGDVGEFLGIKPQPAEGAGLGTQRGGLVTTGLYRHVRHPLYTAGIAFIWLMPLQTTSTLAVNLGLTIYVVIGAVFEERKLRRLFGQEYADYAAVTPMFIPFLKGNKRGGRDV